MRKTLCLIALGLLVSVLLTGGVQARTWHVPSDVATVTEALTLASSGDVIQIAVGVHKIAGYGHYLPGGVTIQSDTGMPGGVILEEEPAAFGGWRNEPVFILNSLLDPSADVIIEGITFRNFTQTFGPGEYASEPVILVGGGSLTMTECDFVNYYGTAVKFVRGSGEFTRCGFLHGRGQPVAIEFSGLRLDMDDCTFAFNSQRFPGDFIQNPKNINGSIVKMISGAAYFSCGAFENNGPLTHLVDIGANASLLACYTCIGDNHSVWQGRVAGTAQLTCCEAVASRWQVVDGGSLIVVDNGSSGTAAVRSTSWSDLKSLFE
jgi:hypothetical protein